MIKEIVKTTDGREITLLRPETPQDVAELAKMQADGELDDSESLGDQGDEAEQDLVDAGILWGD